MTQKWLVDKETELEPIALQILHNYPDKRVFTFSGNLGSGKTTFIKYLCKALGVKEQVSSPTFALVNEYLGANNLKIYHFDIYRIKNVQEAYDMGCEEYLDSGNYCFIEWPEMIKELIPKDAIAIKIEVMADKREIEVNTI
jgi:tRNA threonylcarbamoyladenosine biosynthesis protein TsaE